MSKPKRNIPLLQLAWRNTRRNIRRTLLTASAVMVAVGALIFSMSYMSGVMDNMLDTYARTESGHIRLRQEGYTKRERSMPLHLNLSALSETLEVLRQQPGVAAALPRIRTAALIDGAGSNKPGLVFGLDLEAEDGYFNPAGMITTGRMPSQGAAEVLIGATFAEKLAVAVGDTLILIGQTSYRSMGGLRAVVSGMFKTGIGHLDSRLLIGALDQIQYMTELPDATTEILIFAHDPMQADALVPVIRSAVQPVTPEEVEVLSWRDQGPLIQLMEANKPISGMILFILMLMAGLVIVNTMLMTVMEHTPELGMLAAMGMRRSDIIALIVAEGVIIGAIGAFIGGSLSTAFTIWVEHTGIDITAAAGNIELPFQGILYPDWTLSYTLLSAFLGMLAAGLAALSPAWRAARQKPAEALRP